MRYALKRKLLHLFFPTRCPVCGGIIGAMERFCPECESKLSPYSGHFRISGADSFTAAFDYDDSIKPAVILLKRGVCGNSDYALGGALADSLKAEGIADKADIIVPVPMHRRDAAKRGFNQSKLIAVEVGRILGLPVDAKAVVKSRHTRAQKELSHFERVHNLRGAFIASDSVKGRRVLLIDDVCTTGSTLGEAAAALKKAGALSVHCACCCKTLLKHKKP